MPFRTRSEKYGALHGGQAAPDLSAPPIAATPFTPDGSGEDPGWFAPGFPGWARTLSEMPAPQAPDTVTP